MGKTDQVRGKRYNKIRNIVTKKDLDKRRHRATNNVVVEEEKPVSKPKYGRGVSQYTKAVREFGERRSEFESKNSRGTNFKRTCITKGRLTIPQMGIFMRSKMSKVVVRGGSAHLDEMNKARLNDDLQQIIRLANPNDNQAPPGKEAFLTLREHRSVMPIVVESDDQSDNVDDPPTPRSEDVPVPCTFQKQVGTYEHKLVERPVKEVGPIRFIPKVTSTVQTEKIIFKSRTRGLHAALNNRLDLPQPNARRRLVFPKGRQTAMQTSSDSDEEGEEGEEEEELLSMVVDKENTPDSFQQSREPRLPTGCASHKEMYKTFASSYVGDIHKVYKKFISMEGYSSIQKTREELTASFRKTCERVLTEEGKSVDEENILNVTLQICGPDKYTSPKPGTLSSLRDYKQRNKELFPDTDSEDEVEVIESDPLSMSVEPPQPSTPANTRNLFGLDLNKYPFAPSVHHPDPSRKPNVGPEPEREEEEEDLFSYSPEVLPEDIVQTLNPLRFIQETLGSIESDGRRARRPSVFDAITPRRKVGQQGAAAHSPQVVRYRSSGHSDAVEALRHDGNTSPCSASARASESVALFQSPPLPPTRRHPATTYCRACLGAGDRPALPPPVPPPTFRLLPPERLSYGRVSTPLRRFDRPTGGYRLSSDEGRLECAAERKIGSYDPLMSSSPLTVRFGRRDCVREYPGKARGNRDHHSGADNRTLIDGDKHSFRKIDLHMDDVKPPRFVSPEQRFYQLCSF